MSPAALPVAAPTTPPRAARAGHDSLLYQLAHTTAWRVLATALRGVCAFLVIRLLTVHNYGLYMLLGIGTDFACFAGNLNLNAYLLRALPGRDEARQYAVLRGLSGPLLGWNSLFALGWAVAIPWFIPGALGVMLAVIAAIYIAQLTTSLLVNFFLGCEQVPRANWIQGMRALGLAAALGLLTLGHIHRLGLVLLAWLASELVALATAARWIRWDLWRSVAAPERLWREALVFSLPELASAGAFLAMKFGDRYLIAGFLGLTMVARYSLAYAAVNVLYSLTVLVSDTALVPRIMAHKNRGEIEAHRRALVRSGKLPVYGLIAGGVLLALAPHRLWAVVAGHAEYQGLNGLIAGLAGVMIAYAAGLPAEFALFAQDRTGILGLIDLTGLALMAGFDCLFLPHIGVYGAVLGAALGFATAGIVKYAVAGRMGALHWRDLLDWSDERRVLARLVSALS